MKFYLGLHQPSDAEKTRVPVFVSVSRLIKRVTPMRHDDWIMDSGGFTMLHKHGEYSISEEEYLKAIHTHGPKMAFCQDWMCEPFILEKTGLSVKEHQLRTTVSYLRLVEKDDRIRPVLQGWAVEDYCRHIHLYRKYGVDTSQVFGVGTVCSRNGDPSAVFDIMLGIKIEAPEIKLHGFGVKTGALSLCENVLYSADSMAWSSRGRHDKLCNWCKKKSCANCLEYALLWRKKILSHYVTGRGDL